MTSSIEMPPRSRAQVERHPAEPTVALIPAYNEERFIGSLVLAVSGYVDCVVVVDDGSRDRTREIARRAGAIVVEHRVNRGKAAAVNTGFRYARQMNARALVMLDGDGQHRAEDIPVVMNPILARQADIVVGSRFLVVRSQIPAYRQVGQHSLTAVTNLASGVRVSDSQSGFRAFSRRAIELLSFSQDGFSIESEMQFLVKQHALRVAEAPIKVIYDEKAKRNPVRHGLQVVNAVLRLTGQIRPLLLLAPGGLLMILTSTLLGLNTIRLFTETHQLGVGSGLFSLGLGVIGSVLLFAGILLHWVRAIVNETRRSVLERLGIADVLADDRPSVEVMPAEESCSTTPAEALARPIEMEPDAP